MENKTVIVTGANAGIGKATTQKLAEMGAKIVMVCRNKKKGEIVLEEIREATKNENLDLMICDFASLQSINNFVINFKEKYDKLDILINNHGAFFIRKSKTEDGIESTFAVNHLGYFSLTLQLLEMLKTTPKSRIINVSSGSNYKVQKVVLGDYNYDKRRYSMFKAYAESKLYNIMFTFLLNEKLQGTGISVNCLHPGYVKTNIGLNHFLLRLIAPLVKYGAVKLEEGAETSVYLASSSEVEGVTGKYYHKMKLRDPNKLAFDKKLQQELWDLSLKLANFSLDNEI